MKRSFVLMAFLAFFGQDLVAQKPVDCPSLGIDLSQYNFLAYSSSDADAMFLSSFFVLKDGDVVKLFEEKRMEGSLIGTTLYHFPVSAFANLNKEGFASVVGFGDQEFDYAQLTFNFNDDAGVTRIPHNCESDDEPYSPMVVNELEFYLASPTGFDTFLKMIGK